MTTRDVVRASGPDAASYLQGQISQDVDALSAGETSWSFILAPSGKVDAWFRIHRVGDDEFLLDIDPGFADALIARLERFKLRTAVDFAIVARFEDPENQHDAYQHGRLSKTFLFGMRGLGTSEIRWLTSRELSLISIISQV